MKKQTEGIKPDAPQVPQSAAITLATKNVAIPNSKGVASLIKCEDQGNGGSQSAVLNGLASLKRRKNQVGQKLKPLSSGSDANQLKPAQ